MVGRYTDAETQSHGCFGERGRVTMSRSEKVTLAASLVVVAALVALATPVVAGAVSWASERGADTARAATGEPTVKPTATGSRESADDIPNGYVFMGDGTWIPAGGPGDCSASSMISITRIGDAPATARLLHPENLVDMGPREFAAGKVGYADDGRIATYTVAPGDAPWAIGDRFCIYNGLTIPDLNGHKGYEPIQPGEVLVLDPAAVPGFEYDYPY